LDGPVNLARVYFKEGGLDDAVAALQRAAKFDPPAPRWLLAWFKGLWTNKSSHKASRVRHSRDRYPELDQRG
jgi:cytochrome c-type biogenesis protein CcmH/NrfG